MNERYVPKAIRRGRELVPCRGSVNKLFPCRGSVNKQREQAYSLRGLRVSGAWPSACVRGGGDTYVLRARAVDEQSLPRCRAANIRRSGFLAQHNVQSSAATPA